MKVVGALVKPKRHDQPLKNTFPRFEGSLQNIGLLNWHLMITELQVNIVEILVPLELVEEVVDPGNGMLIPYHDLV